ncbi:hypothetical protein [Ruminococcus difficilis]|uniref:hypothetical protein n=1 Tax=Ruminococcus difficilis TaxID=2763069 RepID=UPI001917A17B|nr:hypothetical protein [Ruminococcus difficilis]
MAEAFISYLTFSVIETPVILRMVDDHPYRSRHLLRVLVAYAGKVTVRRQAPYPTEKWICFAFGWHLDRCFGGSKPPPYNKR